MEIFRESGVASIFTVPLIDASKRPSYKTNPTLEAGDVKVIRHTGGAWDVSNIASLPSAIVGATSNVLVSLTDTELTSDDLKYPIIVQFIDQTAINEWDNQTVIIWTQVLNVDLLKINHESISGNDAILNLKQLNIVCDSGKAVNIKSLDNIGIDIKGGETYEGVKIEGGDDGNGLTISAGESAHGVEINAGTNGGYAVKIRNDYSGPAVSIQSIDGVGFDCFGKVAGIRAISIGDGAGTGLICQGIDHGILATSKEAPSSGAGILAEGGGGPGIEAVGDDGFSGILAKTVDNGCGIEAIGSSDQPGIKVTGGLTGDGMYIEAGPNGNGNGLAVQGQSDGIYAYSQDGANGMYLQGDGEGSGLYIAGGIEGNGIDVDSGPTAGNGINILSDVGIGINVQGGLDKPGIKVSGGITGNAIEIVGGATSGNGIDISTIEGLGIKIIAGGTEKDGISIQGSPDGNGIKIDGFGIGHGIKVAAGIEGSGIVVYGGSDLELGGPAIDLIGSNTNTYAVQIHGGASILSNTALPGLLITGDDESPGVSITGGSSGNGIDIVGAVGPSFYDINAKEVRGLTHLDSEIDTVPISEVLELVMAMVNGRFVKDDPEPGQITFYKRDDVTPLFTVAVTETERERTDIPE
jgi:hypothetical protein